MRRNRVRPNRKSGLVTIRADKVAIRRIDFIWLNRLARGKHTCVAGDPGLGKSQLAIFAIAEVTTGGMLPCGEGKAPVGNVVILSAEDGVEDVLVPRLKAAGADMSRVTIVKGTYVEDAKGKRTFSLQTDLAKLEKLIDEIGDVVLVVVDPVSSYMGKVDSHRNSELRAVLDPVTQLAEDKHVAVLSVTHLTKGATGTSMKVIHRFIGSIAFVGAPRAAFAVVEDPDDKDRRLFLSVKNNLGPRPQGLAFRLAQRIVATDGDGDIVASYVEWDSQPVTTTADEALAATSAPGAAERGSARDEATDFLRQLLKDGPVAASAVWEAADANGIAARTLKRAKSELGVKAQHRPDLDGGWEWVLPEGGQKTPKGATPEDGPLRKDLAPFDDRGTH